MTWIKRLTSRYCDLISKRGLLVFALIAISLVASLFAASKIQLRSDLKELLPPSFQSVKELDRLLARIGGVGSLIVVAESPNLEANKRFMDDLAARLNALPPETIRYVNYKADDIRKFYEDHFLYYLDQPDLDLVYNRIKSRVDYEKFKKTPFFFDLGEEDVGPPKLEFDDISERNKKHYSAPVSTVDDYYGGEWGRMLIMIVRPFGAALSVDSARSLISTIEGVVDGMNPSSYEPSMKIGFCGDVKSTIEEYETLRYDIASTAILCIVLIAASIVIYFLRLRVVFLIGASLAVAIAWTFALTQIVIGYLNAQTAFLLSIIVGTGINYGIILMARYIEERKRDKSPIDAMKLAMSQIITPTFLAAGTTSIAFAALLIARTRGLSQFGFIGGAGVMLCWLSAILVLPILTIKSERVMKIVRVRKEPARRSALMEVASRFPVTHPRMILIGALIAASVSIVVLAFAAPNAIEYDFSKMRNMVSVQNGTEALENRVSKLFKHSMTPSAVLVDSASDGAVVCDAVTKQNEATTSEERRVGSCYSIDNLLPENQEAKLASMARIDELISEDWSSKLKGDLKNQVDRVKRSILDRPLTIDDLPEALIRHFKDLNGMKGAVVFINPRPGMLLSDGRNLMKFADTIRDIKVDDGRIFHAASASIIFSDLIGIIKGQAPLLTLASLVGVILFVVLLLRGMKLSFLVIVCLIWSVIVMMGVASLMGIKINFFNFIVLPLTFGIGVDYAVNMALRIREEGVANLSKAIHRTGGAVVLCSVTTIIGYFVLTRATNQALVTFGIAAVIGEIACIVSAVLILPALITLFEERKNRNSK